MQKAAAGGEEAMEINYSSDELNTPFLPYFRPKGGLKTMPFIIVNQAVEKIANFGVMQNMILYLMREYNMSSVGGTSVLQLCSAMTNFSPLLGAFLSDSYLGRCQVIALGSLVNFLGMVLLWLTAMIPQAKPLQSESPTSSQMALLFLAFVLISAGIGGIRPCSIAFGADQLITDEENPNNPRILGTYFSWYYASAAVSLAIALTVIVYIQDHFGWKMGFGVPAALMFLSTLAFFVGFPFYVKVDANKNLFLGLTQVVVVAFRNRYLEYPTDGEYHSEKGSGHRRPSENLRFLNKACVVRDFEKDTNPDRSARKPWKLCTVEQVEALKSLVRVIPIWSTGIIINMVHCQNSFSVLQGNSMDRHLTRNFQVPPASFAVFSVIALTMWIPVYDLGVIPLHAKLTGKAQGFSNQVRMGIGLALSILAMVLAAIIESIRRRQTVEEMLEESAGGRVVSRMSAFWLAPQFCLLGLALGINMIGQMEFYYSQLPKQMASLAMALSSLNSAIAGLNGSSLVETMDKITKQGGKQSWLASDPNQGHYEYFYLFLALLCAMNFFYFLLCCWAYGPTEKKPEDLSEHIVV